MTRDYKSAANTYRPDSIRVLFVAESPPAFASPSKQSYFFFEDNPGGDILFGSVIEAVLGIKYRKRSGNKTALLRQFQSQGCWLIDAVEYPINRIHGRRVAETERNAIIEKEADALLQRLQALCAEHCLTRDAILVLIKNSCYERLAERLRRSGYNLPQQKAIGFPRYHGDTATIEGIRRVLSAPNFSLQMNSDVSA